MPFGLAIMIAVRAIFTIMSGSKQSSLMKGFRNESVQESNCRVRSRRVPYPDGHRDGSFGLRESIELLACCNYRGFRFDHGEDEGFQARDYETSDGFVGRKV